MAPTHSHGPRLKRHAGVYVAGDKYQMPELKQLALKKFQNSLFDWANDWSDARSKRLVADIILVKLQECYEVISFVYENTVDSSDALRKAIVEFHMAPEMMSEFEDAWTEFLGRTPAYAAELTIMRSWRPEQMDESFEFVKFHKCPNCGFKIRMDRARLQLTNAEGFCFKCGHLFGNWETCIIEDEDVSDGSDD